LHFKAESLSLLFQCLLVGDSDGQVTVLQLRSMPQPHSPDQQVGRGLLAHLRTMSSRWAFVMAHCPSITCPPVRLCINNFFKQLLINHLTKFVEKLQGCSLHEALPKLFKKFNSMKNFDCHGNRKIKKNL